MTGEVLGDELLEECPCIIFRNCSDMEDSINSLTVALTNFLLSLVILALFSALNVSTGSGKEYYSLLIWRQVSQIQSENLLMTSLAVSDNFQMFRILERQTGLHLPEKVYPVFHTTFSFHPQN